MMRGLSALWFKRPWLARCVALVLAALLFAALLPWVAPGLRQLEEQSSDRVWRITASTQPERRVVLVDIDDASLAEIGPWPWSRQTIAELTQKLDAQGVGLKLFDVVFPDERPGSAQLSRALAARSSESPSVLSQVFALRNESHLRSGELGGALPGIGCQAPAVPAQGYVANTPGLHALAGHITPTLDPDGAVRRMAALACMDERSYPALALAGVAALGGSGVPMRMQPGQGLWGPAWTIELPSLPGLKVGVDAQGQIRVPYGVARSAMVSVSAVDVLRGKVEPGLLNGAWVVVGASAFGLADVVPTALGGAVSGAEVHLQLLVGLLDAAVPFTPRAAPWLQGIYTALAVLGMLALAGGAPLQRRQRVLLLPLAAACAAVMAYGLHAWVLVAQGAFVGWTDAALAIVLAGALLAFGEQARSLAEKKRIYQNLASYVSAPVAQQIALSEPSGEIQARRCEVTVLSADLQNFSRYCEACEPEDAAQVLHQFFTTASAIVEAHGGMVEEMVGDSLLAVFNGERPCADHALAALAAARELWQRCTEQLPNTQGLGLEPLGLGVGLESGAVMIGSFGPAGRRVHTVLGQTVTIALRLRALTPDLAYPLLMGQGLAQRLGVQDESEHLAIKPLGSFLLQGLLRPGHVYTLRHLLQPGGAAEQRTLLYLHRQQNFAA